MDASEIPPTLADPAPYRASTPCWVTVAVAGEIDLATGPDVLATLLAAAKPETAGIVVDVSGVSFFSAAGVGALLQARDHERQHGRDLLLRAPPPIVTLVLDICDLTDLVEPLGNSRAQVRPGPGIGTTAPRGAGPSRQHPRSSRAQPTVLPER